VGIELLVVTMSWRLSPAQPCHEVVGTLSSCLFGRCTSVRAYSFGSCFPRPNWRLTRWRLARSLDVCRTAVFSCLPLRRSVPCSTEERNGTKWARKTGFRGEASVRSSSLVKPRPDATPKSQSSAASENFIGLTKE
jgi:hypothetical protein